MGEQTTTYICRLVREAERVGGSLLGFPGTPGYRLGLVSLAKCHYRSGPAIANDFFDMLFNIRGSGEFGEHRAITGNRGPWVRLEAGGEPLVSRTTDEDETSAFPFLRTQLVRPADQTTPPVERWIHEAIPGWNELLCARL